MQKGEEGAEGSAEKYNIISITDGTREGLLVGVQSIKKAIQQGRGVLRGFEVAVEFEKLWKERKNEGEGNLTSFSKTTMERERTLNTPGLEVER